jgi:hypothetical protein
MFVKSSKNTKKFEKVLAHSHSHPLKQKVWYKPEMCPETNFRMIDLNVFSPIFLIYSTIPKALSSKIEGFGVVLGVGYGENLCPRGSS